MAWRLAIGVIPVCSYIELARAERAVCQRLGLTATRATWVTGSDSDGPAGQAFLGAHYTPALPYGQRSS